MDAIEAGSLFVAAILAGALNAVVGAGTLITFPTLLALGFSPVVANVSNTVGLVPGSLTAAYAYRSTFSGRWRLIRRLVIASSVGGIVGAFLLLSLPPETFALVVPVLLLGSAALAAVQPRIALAVAKRRNYRAGRPDERDGDRSSDSSSTGALFLLAILGTGIYGGYFGAAQGVILLALLGIFLEGGIVQLNGIKNILAGVANIVSASVFVMVADVHWAAAGVVAAGATIGGGLGGRYGRRLPAPVLRAMVVGVGVIAALWQWQANR